MATFTVSKPGQLLWPKGAGAALIVNTDTLNTVYIDPEQAVSTRSDQVPPLGSVAIDGSRNVYAATLTAATVAVQVMQGATQWAPSPAQVAAQVAASQAPGPNLIPLPSYATGITSTPIQPVAFPSVHLRVLPSTGYAVVTLSWYADAAGSQLLGSDQWHVFSNGTVSGAPNGTALNVCIPCQGDYFKVTFNVTSVAALSGVLYCAGVFAAPPAPVYYVTQDGIINAALVPASTTQIYPIAFIQKGAAHFSLEPFDASGKNHYTLVLLKETGAVVTTLYDFGLPTAAAIVPITLTDDSIALQVQNTDAAGGHSAQFNIIPAN